MLSGGLGARVFSWRRSAFEEEDDEGRRARRRGEREEERRETDGRLHKRCTRGGKERVTQPTLKATLA